jgi:pyrroloquinoline quinone biosynthesis protein D
VSSVGSHPGGPDPGAPQRRIAFDQQLPLQLGKHFRLQWEPSQGCHVLLYPEGMVQLQGGAEEIMKRIDGKTTLLELIRALEAAFPGADLREDVLEFAEIAYAKGWLMTRAASES